MAIVVEDTYLKYVWNILITNLITKKQWSAIFFYLKEYRLNSVENFLCNLYAKEKHVVQVRNSREALNHGLVF